MFTKFQVDIFNSRTTAALRSSRRILWSSTVCNVCIVHGKYTRCLSISMLFLILILFSFRYILDLHAAARATCHVPPVDPRPAPSSFRRFGPSIGASPAPIGPAVRALFPEMLGHTHRQTDWQTPSGQLFSATHRRKSLFIKRAILKHWHLLFSTAVGPPPW